MICFYSRYAQPAIKVFFCDDEKEDIPGIIRKFCPLAQFTDISQLKGNEMLSSAKASSPSLLYLSPNIRFPVLDFVRNLVPVLPGKEQMCKNVCYDFQHVIKVLYEFNETNDYQHYLKRHCCFSHSHTPSNEVYPSYALVLDIVRVYLG